METVITSEEDLRKKFHFGGFTVFLFFWFRNPRREGDKIKGNIGLSI